MDCSLLGSSVHGVFQARILEWVAISSSRGSSWCRDWTCVSCFAHGFFIKWATGEVPKYWGYSKSQLGGEEKIWGIVDVLCVQSHPQEVMANTQCGGGEMKPPPFQAGDWPTVGMGWPGPVLLNEITYFDYITTLVIVISDQYGHSYWLNVIRTVMGYDPNSIPGHRKNQPARAIWRDSSVQFSRPVMSDTLRPHESQHASPPCPSPTPGVHSDSVEPQITLTDYYTPELCFFNIVVMELPNLFCVKNHSFIMGPGFGEVLSMAADMGRLLCCCVGHDRSSFVIPTAALGGREACLMEWSQVWRQGAKWRGRCRSTGLVSEPETVELLADSRAIRRLDQRQ